MQDWPRAHGSPLYSATIRHIPEDFSVTEMLGFEPSGDGEHDFLYVQKTGTNTEWLSRQLAGFADVPAKDIGYSGLKDRHAVTRQWFSVPRWNQPNWSEFVRDGVVILDVKRNSRKLRRGAHTSNRFELVLRGTTGDRDRLEARLNAIRNEGVPNYFGEQRFGRGGANIGLADAWAAGKRLARHKRSIAISTARSLMFNEQLASNVERGRWNTLIVGDIANLDGSGSVFAVDRVDAALEERSRTLDIHPTGVLWGDGSAASEVPAGHGKWQSAIAKARVKPARRAMRLRVAQLEWQVASDSLRLSFELCRGAFATAVLREIVDINSVV